MFLTGSGSCWTPSWLGWSPTSPAAPSPTPTSQSHSSKPYIALHPLRAWLWNESFINIFLYRIRRKTLYYMYNIVFPCMMMSTLTVLVFCMPPDSGEKIALGVTVILAFSVFMLAIAERMPETSESIPLIGNYRGKLRNSFQSVLFPHLRPWIYMIFSSNQKLTEQHKHSTFMRKLDIGEVNLIRSPVCVYFYKTLQVLSHFK